MRSTASSLISSSFNEFGMKSAHPLRRLRAFNLLSSPVSLAFLSIFAYNTTRKSPFPPSAGRKEAICLTAPSPPTKSAALSLSRRCGTLLPLTPPHPSPRGCPSPAHGSLSLRSTTTAGARTTRPAFAAGAISACPSAACPSAHASCWMAMKSPGTTARSPRLRQSCAACPTANMR